MSKKVGGGEQRFQRWSRVQGAEDSKEPAAIHRQGQQGEDC